MRVYVFPADLGGCGYYRLIWPAKVLQSFGHDVRLVHPKQMQKLSGSVNAEGKLVGLNAPSDADVMVFQRISSRYMVDGIKLLRANGVTVVVDIDDDMSAIHPGNPAFEMLRPGGGNERAQDYDWNSARLACAAASWVTVSTPALLPRYAPDVRGTVLYNAVPEIYLNEEVFPRIDAADVAWPASLATHPDDPSAVGSAVARLVREGAQFRIVSHGNGCRRAFQLEQEPEATGGIAVEKWPEAVNRIGVGIAPLRHSRFNTAKSWLKPLEMSALGVPWVASATSEYRRIHERGAGLLASSPREWYSQLRRLVDDPELRDELSRAGREAVRELTIEATAHLWWETWQQAYAVDHDVLGRPFTGPRTSRTPRTPAIPEQSATPR